MFIASLHVRVEQRPNGQFAVLVDGEEVGRVDTKEEADDKAQAEAFRIEGL